MLARLRAQAEALAACGGVQVAWSEGAGLPETLRMDEALVERAVMNVVANAVEHAPAGSTVEVRVRAEAAPADEGGGMLAVSVADAGPGFSPEALRRGCERFYQGDPARAAHGHRGLGLHVAAEAAERHGGAVELANREEGGRRRSLRDAAVPSILSPWRGVALGRRAPMRRAERTPRPFRTGAERALSSACVAPRQGNSRLLPQTASG